MQEMYNFYFFNTKCWTMFELFRLYKKHKTNKLWILWFDFILFFQNFLLLSLQFLSIQAEYKMLSLKGTIYPKAEQLSWQWRIWHRHPEQAALEAIFFHLHKTLFRTALKTRNTEWLAARFFLNKIKEHGISIVRVYIFGLPMKLRIWWYWITLN